MEILEIIIDKKLFSSEDIEELGIVENQCLKLVNFKNSTDLKIDDEVLENFDCVLTANELGSAIKKISDGKIVEHLIGGDARSPMFPIPGFAGGEAGGKDIEDIHQIDSHMPMTPQGTADMVISGALGLQGPSVFT